MLQFAVLRLCPHGMLIFVQTGPRLRFFFFFWSVHESVLHFKRFTFNSWLSSPKFLFYSFYKPNLIVFFSFRFLMYTRLPFEVVKSGWSLVSKKKKKEKHFQHNWQYVKNFIFLHPLCTVHTVETIHRTLLGDRALDICVWDVM